MTEVAAFQFALPACDAVIEQVPTATTETTVPETVHTAVSPETTETSKPEVAE